MRLVAYIVNGIVVSIIGFELLMLLLGKVNANELLISSILSGISVIISVKLLKSGRQFDVVVADVEMPGMSGFDLAQAVHADAKTAKLPLIALSSIAIAAISSSAAVPLGLALRNEV